MAVGVTALSSEDMYMSGGHGKCVEIYHILGDFLCQMDKPLPRPELGPPGLIEENCQEILETREEIENIEINKKTEEIEEIVNDHVDKLSIETEFVDPVQEMDKLLEYCFLKACKVSLKRGDLPIITSTFFKNHMLSVCPSNCSVDVKKSSYKKLSIFLANMKAKGLIDTTVLKGVESLLSVKVRKKYIFYFYRKKCLNSFGIFVTNLTNQTN